MQLHDFLGRLQERSNLHSKDEALRAVQATYQTLSERLAGGEPLNLAAQLPSLLQDRADAGHGERFSAEEFCRRVAEREGVDKEMARKHAQAVLAVTQEAVSAGEIEDVLAQLPQEYHALFGGGRSTRPM